MVALISSLESKVVLFLMTGNNFVSALSSSEIVEKVTEEK